MTNVERLVAKWQRILKLQDWSLEVEIVSTWDLADGALAQTEVSGDSRYAKVKLLAPASRPKEEPDFEQTVVHELCHIPLYAWETEPNTLNRLLLEQAVDGYAWSLVELDRRK